MRLFVAADVSADTRDALRDLRRGLDSAWPGAGVAPRVGWVDADRAHVTLQFIGEADERTADLVQAALQPPFDLSPFDVHWDTIGLFPPATRSPRVIWIGASQGADELVALAAQVGTRLAGAMGQSAHGPVRPFTPHVTVGRIKHPGRGVDWRRVVAASPVRPTTTRVEHVTLYRSQTGRLGPTYTALGRAILRGT